MFFSIQFLFYLIFFLIKLYSLLDKFVIFSSNGTKLKKYVSKKYPSSMVTDFENKHYEKFILNIKEILTSPERYKNIIRKILVSASIIAIYLAFTYKYIFSDFLYLSIFNKNISLNNIFGKSIIYIQICFIFLFSFFIINVVNSLFKIFLKYLYKFNQNNNNNSFSLNKIIHVDLAKDNNGNVITINEQGLYQNILITGSIGSGKTSSAITNILDNLIYHNISGLIIDVKGNFVNTVYKVLSKYNLQSKLKVISLTNNFSYNPVDKPEISAYELASRVRQALELVSPGSKNSDSYWLDKVQNYICDFIVIVREYNEFVSFDEIHKLVLNRNYLDEKLEYIKKKMIKEKYTDEKLYEILNAVNNLLLEYYKLDERTLSIIKSEITRITAPFVSNLEIKNQFCTKNKGKLFLDDSIVVLSINIGENKSLAKLISTYLKLDFQKTILSGKNIISPKFFICDEYQEFANKEDSNFFSVSREYKCINVVSMQSYTSLLNTIQDEYSTRVIIQNLVNKIWFRNDDTYTISEIIKQIGKEIKEYKTMSVSEGGGESKYNLFYNKFKSTKSGLTESYSIAEKDEYVLNEKYFSTTLKTFEASLIISDGINMNFVKKATFKRWEEKSNV